VTSDTAGRSSLRVAVVFSVLFLILLDVVFLFFFVVFFFWVSGNEGIGSDHVLRDFGVPFGTYFAHGQSYAHGRPPVSP